MSVRTLAGLAMLVVVSAHAGTIDVSTPLTGTGTYWWDGAFGYDFRFRASGEYQGHSAQINAVSSSDCKLNFLEGALYSYDDIQWCRHWFGTATVDGVTAS